MQYVTRDGLRLEIGRIGREVIDAYAVTNPPPEPPMRKVEAWGGIVEDVPVPDDLEYRARLLDYHVAQGERQIELIAEAITMPDQEAVPTEELAELQAIGLCDGGWPDTLRYLVLAHPADMAAAVELVLYQSTVTERGVEEAARAFNVTWAGRPVLTIRPPSTPGQYSMIYEARLAARYSGYAWGEFCALTGPEQSAAVAFHLLDLRLEWLAAQRAATK